MIKVGNTEAQSSVSKPRVLVIQFGARRQYDMPIMLQKAGLLEGLYTDLCGAVGPGRILASLAPFGGTRLKKLSARTPPPGVAEKTRTFPRWTFDMERAMRATDPEVRVKQLDIAHDRAGKSMIRAGFGNATHILSVFLEGRNFLSEAKARNLKVITDMVIAPSAEHIVREERRLNPGWEPDGYYWGETLVPTTPGFRPSAQSLEETDLFLCPSQFVRDDLVNHFNVQGERTCILPYTVNPRWFDVPSLPEPGRILFVGDAGLRKGIHILSAAAAILKGRGRKYNYRVAGHAGEMVRSHPSSTPLTFLGRLDYEALREEFSHADVFAFPSLAEGSAGVTYEALACGVPVVTTKSSGSVIRDGIEGTITRERDPEALADALEAIIEDRTKRETMAQAARERARHYSWENYSDRFIAAIKQG